MVESLRNDINDLLEPGRLVIVYELSSDIRAHWNHIAAQDTDIGATLNKALETPLIAVISGGVSSVYIQISVIEIRRLT